MTALLRRLTGPLRRAGRSVPTLVWVITGMHIALLAAYSLAYPTLTGYDETQHVDMVVALQHHEGWPAPASRIMAAGVAGQGTRMAGLIPPYPADRTETRGNRDGLTDRGGLGPGSYPVPNQMTQHPPLYYAAGALVMSAIPGSLSDLNYDQYVWLLRLLSIACMAPLPLIVWGTARALRAPPAVSRLAPLTLLMIPNLYHVGSSVTNDTMLILLFSSTTLVCCQIAMGDVSRRSAVIVGVLAGLDLLVKAFALFSLPMILLAYLIAWRREPRAQRRLPWRPAAWALAVSFLAGGWWWPANLIRYGTLQPDGLGTAWAQQIREIPPAHPAPASVGHFLDLAYDRLSLRFFGGMKFQYFPPDVYSQTTTDIFVGVLVVGVLLALAMLRRHTRMFLVVACLGLGPVLLQLAVLLHAAWPTYRYNRNPGGLQGRYLYHFVPLLVVMVTLGYHGLAERLGARATRWLPAVVAVTAVAGQWHAFRYILKVNWLPRGEHNNLAGTRDAVHVLLSWSPWPRLVTMLPFLATAVLAVVLLLLTVPAARRPPADRPTIRTPSRRSARHRASAHRRPPSLHHPQHTAPARRPGEVPPLHPPTPTPS